MAEATHSDTAEVGATKPETASPELTPVMKVTRARASTSGAPRKSAAPKVTAMTVAPASPSDGSKTGATRAEGAVVGRPANVSIYQGGADSVAGDAVTITQGGASIVNATSVDIRQGGIANAQAEDIHVSMGGVALARADRVSVEMGGLGIAFAREANLTQGGARTVIAQDVRVDQGLIGTAFAGKVTFERPSGVFLLLAGKTEGPVKALLDWRGALAFGAAVGVIAGLLRRR